MFELLKQIIWHIGFMSKNKYIDFLKWDLEYLKKLLDRCIADE